MTAPCHRITPSPPHVQPCPHFKLYMDKGRLESRFRSICCMPLVSAVKHIPPKMMENYHSAMGDNVPSSPSPSLATPLELITWGNKRVWPIQFPPPHKVDNLLVDYPCMRLWLFNEGPPPITSFFLNIQDQILKEHVQVKHGSVHRSPLLD